MKNVRRACQLPVGMGCRAAAVRAERFDALHQSDEDAGISRRRMPGRVDAAFATSSGHTVNRGSWRSPTRPDGFVSAIERALDGPVGRSGVKRSIDSFPACHGIAHGMRCRADRRRRRACWTRYRHQAATTAITVPDTIPSGGSIAVAFNRTSSAGATRCLITSSWEPDSQAASWRSVLRQTRERTVLDHRQAQPHRRQCIRPLRRCRHAGAQVRPPHFPYQQP